MDEVRQADAKRLARLQAVARAARHVEDCHSAATTEDYCDSLENALAATLAELQPGDLDAPQNVEGERSGDVPCQAISARWRM